LNELPIAEARRLALDSLGLNEPRPAEPSLDDLRAVAARLHAFQVDSVNVLVRAHYMPAFSRLGPYQVAMLDDLAYAKRELFEYWAHANCLVETSLYPLFRWRMEAHREADYWARAEPEVRRFTEAVLAEVVERGPLSASEVTGAGKAKGSWWGWSDGKEAMETLWRIGRVAIAGRRRFERLYDLPDRVIPQAILETPAPAADEAKKQLLVLGAKAIGVGTARDIAGYFHIEGWWDRVHKDGTRRRSELPRLVRELVEEARLEPLRVEGWPETAYTLPNLTVLKPVRAQAIVSPFDPVMWERVSTKSGHWAKRLFGLDYMIEITFRRPNVSTATTCCRSCSATGSRPAST
jgi:hypothetical protein